MSDDEQEHILEGLWWKNLSMDKNLAKYDLYDGGRPTGFCLTVEMIKLGDYRFEVYFEYTREESWVNTVEAKVHMELQHGELGALLEDLKGYYALWLTKAQAVVEGAKALIDEDIYDYCERASRELDDPAWIPENDEDMTEDGDDE